MTSKLADNVVEIASDGTISQRASVAEALRGNPKLLEQAAEDTEVMQKDNEIIDEPKPDGTVGRASGKLIADEEVALGRVSMKASMSESFVVFCDDWFLTICLKVMLYFANMGGVGFWVAFCILLLGVEFMNVYVGSSTRG